MCSPNEETMREAWVVWFTLVDICIYNENVKKAYKFPAFVCDQRETAIRLSKGTAHDIEKSTERECTKIEVKQEILNWTGETWTGPVAVIPPSAADLKAQAEKDDYEKALDIIRDAGISEDIINRVSQHIKKEK